MASVKMFRGEVREGRLPRICMRCGAPAELQKCKRFAWHPGWVNLLILVGILPWVIVALVLTKRMTVYAPLCRGHRNHWLIRSLIAFGGLATLAACFVATVIALSLGEQRAPGASNELGGYACIGSLGLLLLFLIVAVISQQTSIRPAEITDRSITLVGVAREFKDALQELDEVREAIPLDEEARVQGRPERPAEEEFFDPEARRRRRSSGREDG